MNDEESTAITPKICEQLTKNITTIQFNTNIARLKIINNIWGKIKYHNFQKVPSKLQSSKEEKKMIYEINNFINKNKNLINKIYQPTKKREKEKF